MPRARAVDARGGPLPMFTYPAIDFLRTIEPALRDAEVLEFGCGQSTKWFAPRVKRLVGIEKNAQFRDVLKADFADQPHIDIRPNDLPFQVEGQFDIIVLDGEPPIESGRFATRALKADGLIIFDNSDVQSLSEIPKLLHNEGFGGIDLIGHSPTGVFKQATSLFIRDPKWLRMSPTVAPVSANSISEQLA
jgi:SAM-dependent methyltransferase